MEPLNQLPRHRIRHWIQLIILVSHCLSFCPSNAASGSDEAHASHGHDKADHHSAHQSKPAEPSDHSVQQQEALDHRQMNHDAMEHTPMDHSKMDHSHMQHSAITGMTHEGHEQAATNSQQPTEHSKTLRDPHAYAEGYTVGHFARHRMGDEEPMASVMMDRLESVNSSSNNGLTYDFQAWYGLTYNRLLARAEGNINKGRFENARSELLWAHALTPYWDSQIGIRYDSGRGTDRGWLAFGVQGLAPYWLYVEATGYVNEQGRTAFRLELEYDVLITQKLILQPRTELNFYSQSDPSRNVQSGLSDSEVGIRLRYEWIREFAPYIGVDWEYRPGQNDIQQQRSMAGSVSELRFVAGVRFWY